MSFRRVITAIISLAYLAFLVMCCISTPAFFAAKAEGGDAASVSVAPAEPTPEPVAQVALGGGSYPENAESLSLVLGEGDLAQLASFPALRSVDFSGSTNYAEIMAWASEHPNVDVTYTVALPGGVTVSNKDTSADLSSLSRENALEVLPLLSYLPALKSLDLGSVSEDSAFTSDSVSALRQALPETELVYSVSVMGQVLDASTTSLDMSGMTREQLDAVIPMLGGMPNLTYIDLGAEGSSAVTWQDIYQIGPACPNAVLDYSYNYWGKTGLNLKDEELNLSHVGMNDEGAGVAKTLPLMRNCTFVDMDSCNVSNAAMRKLQEDNPNMEIVWRIWFGDNYSVRTDVIKILASKPSKGGPITDKDVDALSCCTKIKYIDLGHNETLYDCSFFYSMPDLEVAILTMTGISDITPLSACPHLEYLELTHTTVSDLSPLSDAQELRHLNIGDTQVSDITSLYGLTNLERLFICLRHHVPQDQIDEMQRRAPNCEINVDQDDPSLGAWRYANLTDRGWAHYLETGYFLFDNHPRYDLLREQFGYDNEEYAFYWLDPLY